MYKINVKHMYIPLVTITGIAGFDSVIHEHLARTLINRIVEHGLWAALWSSANHWERLLHGAPFTEGTVLVPETWFEYYLLLFGLGMSVVVFAVEIIVWKIYK